MTDPAALQIRYATTADVETIVAFNYALALESEQLSLDRSRLEAGVHALLSDPSKGRYFLAERESKVVGQTMITYEWSDWRNGVFWWIQSVYVVPEARKHGVFKALFRHIEEEARRLGIVCGLRLYVEQHNQTALRTYERLGMERTAYQMYECDFVIRRG
ncbi:MAG: GNAT family N-acetyltransferase [Acidobacteriota bacterium]